MHRKSISHDVNTYDNKSWEMQMWKKEGERGGKASAHNKQLMKIIQKQISM